MNFFWISISILFLLPMSFAYGTEESEVDKLLDKGNQHLKLEEYEQAIKYYDQILEKNSTHIRALYFKGFSLSMLEKYDESIPYFEQVLKIDPYNNIALIRLQDALLKITSYWYGTLQGVLEMSVHDSEGRLVAYLRTTDIKAIKHQILYDLVDSWPVTQEIVDDNIKIQVHQREFIKVVNDDSILGFHEILYSDKIHFPLATTWHYQVPVERGDVISYVYSIFRPIK